MTLIRPLLAASKWDEDKVHRHLREAGFLWMQPKIDGMRALIDQGVARSRSWKPLGNRHLQQFAQDFGATLQGLDNEVVAGHVYDPNTFRASMSGIRAEEGAQEFTLYILDKFDTPNFAYNVRRAKAEVQLGILGGEGVIVTHPSATHSYKAKMVMCPQIQVSTLDQIYAHELELLDAGWEGAILRRNDRGYKYNRATPLGGELLKLKRFETDEAIVEGCEPWQENQNEATESALGYTTRSAHQDGKVEQGRLGALCCRLRSNPSVKFKIGVFLGLTHTDRDTLWTERESLIGRIAEFKHQGYSGGYSAPRTPVFLKWRPASEF